VDWIKIKQEIYYEDGSLRDIVTENSMPLEKWELLCEYLKDNYNLRIHCDGIEMRDRFDYALAKNCLFDKEHNYIASFSICNVHFSLYLPWGGQFLEFDFFPNEIDGLDKHRAIIEFMTKLANILQITLKMTGEGCSDAILVEIAPATK